MENRIAYEHPTSELRRRTARALIQCGLWLRIGHIGAYGLVAGLLLLVEGEVKPLSALALAVGGGVLAALGWSRGRAVLDIVDEAAVTSGASLPASAASGDSASRPSSMQGGRSTTPGAAPRFAATQPDISS